MKEIEFMLHKKGSVRAPPSNCFFACLPRFASVCHGCERLCCLLFGDRWSASLLWRLLIICAKTTFVALVSVVSQFIQILCVFVLCVCVCVFRRWIFSVCARADVESLRPWPPPGDLSRLLIHLKTSAGWGRFNTDALPLTTPDTCTMLEEVHTRFTLVKAVEVQTYWH